MAGKDNRRILLKKLFAGTLAVVAAGKLRLSASERLTHTMKGNINHSVCRWCFNDLSMDQLCQEARRIGLKGIDLVGPADWPVLQKYGLVSTMCNGAEISLVKGWNNPAYHETLIANYTKHIDLVADAGYTNLICFSGNRDGMDDATGLTHCAEGLKKIMAHAERRGVLIIMELLNSKVDHPDYMCDRTHWGVELCKRIGSPNFKLLYDIYHMQIDEGDVIRTIRENHAYIGHYHTAGVPGRHEIDDSQELYYPAIMKAIADTGFKGYVAQEFMPLAADKLSSLQKAVMICDI